MRKTTFVIVSVTIFALGMVAASIAGGKLQEPMRVHVIEHAKTDAVVDLGAPGDSSGDLLTFHNVLYNSSNTKVAGHDQGECVRIAPVQGTWECRWTAWISGMGSITVEGRFSDNHSTTLAVTGGTGLFKNARGTMNLRFRSDPAEFGFIYNLIP
jgi:hypothetical protein